MMMVMVMVVVMMMMLVVLIMLVLMLMMMAVILVLYVVIVGMVLYLTNPCGRCCHIIKVEATCSKYLLKVHITIVAVYNLCLWLYGTYYLAHPLQLLRRYL